ncbi:MAG: hypothetical protein GYB34_12305 [Gammaproteobacteria bacterium]|nr:hypothetical protein [Gammaproteobacteria bacterium]|tara:strand:+ start:757 stop:2865 length:2109 start_codon:yes stop_codon:yes gene_type:complete
MSCIIAFSAQCGERYSFSYTFDGSPRGTPGEVLSGIIEGKLTDDGDTIIIEKFIEADLSGINYNLSNSTEMRAADPVNLPKMSLSGDVLDFWVCAKGFDGFYENGGGDCAFGVTGGFLISPYVDVNTAECLQLDEAGQCINWAWAGIPEKTNDYRVGDVPANKSNWGIVRLLPSEVGEIVTPKGSPSEPVLFSFNSDTDRYFVRSLSGSFNLSWQGTYTQVSLYSLPDMNGNGSQEIGLFGIRSDNGNEGKLQLFIKDTLTGSRVSVLNWVANWSDASIVVLPDMSGDGISDIALQGIFKEKQRPQLLVRNGLSNAPINTFSMPSLWENPTYFSFSDVNEDGTHEIALFGKNLKNGKSQVRVIDGILPSEKFSSYNFPNNWSETRWINIADFNGDGADDWALLGKAITDSRWQLIVKDGLSPRGVLSIYAWPDLINTVFGRINDITEDGLDEFALGGFSVSRNRWLLQIKDGQDRSTLLHNVSWANKWSDASLHILNDIDGDGIKDVALLGVRSNYELAYKLSRDGYANEVIVDLGSEWVSKPYVGFITEPSDTSSEFSAYGMVNEEVLILPASPDIPAVLSFNLTIDFIITSQEGSICNTEEEYVGLEGSDVGELTLDEFAGSAVLVMDIEGEGIPMPIEGLLNASEQTIELVYENDVFELFITSQSSNEISISGTITNTETHEQSNEQCVTVWEVDISGK